MLGVSERDCRDVIVRDLHLDGSNTYHSYSPGETPEHNHGIFLHRKGGVIENILIEDCLIENFSGDCVGVSVGVAADYNSWRHSAQLRPAGNSDGRRYGIARLSRD